MSNTQTAKADKKAAQEAQAGEANGTPRSFEFDGYTYEILDGQPSWIALDYVARWQVDDDNLALIPAVREMIGNEQFRLAASRHRGDQLGDFFVALNKAAGGNA